MGRKINRFVDQQLKFDSKLVNIVKEHRHLFDKSHKLFEDSETWTKTWDCIAEQLGVSDSFCENRWLCIIDRLYDEIIWMIKYQALSPWLLLPQLEFLENFITLEDLRLLSNELDQIVIELDDVD